MDLLVTVFIGIGLAMDTVAVSVSNGVTIKEFRLNLALKIAIFFGAFQAFMPLIGWLVGVELRDLISGIDHWVAFGILGFIGIKMLYEAFKHGENGKKINLSDNHILLLLSLATSIDALVVGISFAFLRMSIGISAAIIGITTFLLSFLGSLVGNKLGHFCKNKIEIVGGLILIGIGTKILIEHLSQ